MSLAFKYIHQVGAVNLHCVDSKLCGQQIFKPEAVDAGLESRPTSEQCQHHGGVTAPMTLCDTHLNLEQELFYKYSQANISIMLRLSICLVLKNDTIDRRSVIESLDFRATKFVQIQGTRQHS